MNKTALVTGGGTGIGKGICRVLAENGYDIGIHYNKSAEGAKKVQEEIRMMGRNAEIFQADLCCLAEIKRLFSEFETAFGYPYLFVNNSGITKKAPFLEMEEKDFDLMYSLNLKGAYFCMQSAAKLMIKNKTEGCICVISSNNAYAHFADASAYGTFKAALNKAAEHAALELSKYGIRVNTICPGWTDTGASRLEEKEKTFYKIPLKRWCLPEEIGKAVLFFAEDYAKSITGASLTMDGGAVLLSDKGEKYGF